MGLVVVTAADRAAATYAALRTSPSAHISRAEGFLQRAPSAERAVRGSLFRLRNSEVALATGVFNLRLNTPPFR